MPELPDVEVFKEYLDATALHHRIESAHVETGRLLRGVSASTLSRRLKGQELASSYRHGKHLFAAVDGQGWLRLHFGMTGTLKYFRGVHEAPQHTRLRLDFPDDSHLAYVNVRQFGEIGWAESVDRFIQEQALGPDAMALDLTDFRERLAGRRGTIKSVLMNQRVMAGVGNLYADETLFQAGVHPCARTDQLDRQTIEHLHRAMRRVLHTAIDARVERFPPWFMLTHRDGDMRCPRCDAPLTKAKISGRTTFYCERHQKR